MSAVKSCSNPICGNTESRPGEFKSCSRCKQVYYCSKECQLQHWKNGHKNVCKPANSSSLKISEPKATKSETTGEQLAILRKECQTMYNNYEMAKNDLEVLKLKLESVTKSKQQMEKMDKSNNTYFAYGSMYMSQSCEDSEKVLNERIEKLTKEIEKTTVQVQYFEKRYKELESNLADM